MLRQPLLCLRRSSRGLCSVSTPLNSCTASVWLTMMRSSMPSNAARHRWQRVQLHKDSVRQRQEPVSKSVAEHSVRPSVSADKQNKNAVEPIRQHASNSSEMQCSRCVLCNDKIPPQARSTAVSVVRLSTVFSIPRHHRCATFRSHRCSMPIWVIVWCVMS